MIGITKVQLMNPLQFKVGVAYLVNVSNKVLSRNMTSVAICQITTNHDKEYNFEICSKLISSASKEKAKMVFLPEACDYMGRSTKETVSLAESLNGSTVCKYKDLAKNLKMWISLGGIHEKVTDRKVHNSHVIINDSGEIAGIYRKVHLFDVEIPEKKLSLKESKYVLKGMKIGPPVSAPIGNIGMGICYDLRFPAFSQKLVKMGAEILTYPSAFTTATGPAHWEILLRARAIESQCFVIAAAQVGSHFEGRSSYGHGMIVDPWGNILGECLGEKESIVVADVDLGILNNFRRNIPVQNHQRNDLYYAEEHLQDPVKEQHNYEFGNITITSSVVFFKTHLTIAFVNKRCVLPGHVLVAPIRVAKRLADLTTLEAADFIEVIRIVQKGMEHVHNTSSSTVTIQDGEDAGQTVFHVHAHIIPRKKNDLDQNDEIYSRLENHERNEKISIRTLDEMNAEAVQLRQHFKS